MNWKFAAAEQLLDRALGKASQEVTVNRDTNVSVKFETFEDVQRGLQDFGLDIKSSPLKLVGLLLALRRSRRAADDHDSLARR